MLKGIIGLGVLLVSLTSGAHIIYEPDRRGGVEVLQSITVQKNDTCIGITTKAGHSLTQAECGVLLKQIGRLPKVDTRNPMMQVIVYPHIQPNDRFLYVESNTKKGWVLVR